MGRAAEGESTSWQLAKPFTGFAHCQLNLRAFGEGRDNSPPLRQGGRNGSGSLVVSGTISLNLRALGERLCAAAARSAVVLLLPLSVSSR